VVGRGRGVYWNVNLLRAHARHRHVIKSDPELIPLLLFLFLFFLRQAATKLPTSFTQRPCGLFST